MALFILPLFNQKIFMDLEGQPYQFEFITNRPESTTAVMTGEKLIGDIDSMYSNSITMFPTDGELKSILVFNTSLVVTDTYANTIEASTDLIVNVYNYDHQLGIEEIYGLFTYSTVFNYMEIYNAIKNNRFFHNDEIYAPPVIIPSFEKTKDKIIKARNSAYGLD